MTREKFLATQHARLTEYVYGLRDSIEDAESIESLRSIAICQHNAMEDVIALVGDLINGLHPERSTEKD